MGHKPTLYMTSAIPKPIFLDEWLTTYGTLAVFWHELHGNAPLHGHLEAVRMDGGEIAIQAAFATVALAVAEVVNKHVDYTEYDGVFAYDQLMGDVDVPEPENLIEAVWKFLNSTVHPDLYEGVQQYTEGYLSALAQRGILSLNG